MSFIARLIKPSQGLPSLRCRLLGDFFQRGYPLTPERSPTFLKKSGIWGGRFFSRNLLDRSFGREKAGANRVTGQGLLHI